MAEPFHMDPKKEKVFLLIAGIASIAGFVLYLRAQQAAAASAAAGLDPSALGGGGDTSGAGSTGVSGAQGDINQELGVLAQDQQAGFTGLTNQLAANNQAYIAALHDLFNNGMPPINATPITVPIGGTTTPPGTGVTGPATVNLDLSVQGSTNDHNDATWNDTGSSYNSGTESHSGGGSGSGGLNVFGLFSIGGGGKSSNSESNTWNNGSAYGNAGTSNYDQATTFGQNITLSETGLDTDTLYNLTNELVDTSKRAQTAAVNPKSLATPYLFQPLSGSLLLNPGQYGFNRPSRYNASPSNVGRDARYNNWALEPVGMLPKRALNAS